MKSIKTFYSSILFLVIVSSVTIQIKDIKNTSIYSTNIITQYIGTNLAIMLFSKCITVYIFMGFGVKYLTGIQLTFQLADNARECFYEEIKQNISMHLRYMVVHGGRYDVDVTVEDTNKEIIYTKTKLRSGNYSFIADHGGIYTVCFNNEFSTFSEKLVFMQLDTGEKSLPGIGEHATVLTQMESQAQDIHKRINTIMDTQTQHRLEETQSRKRANDLNERVLWFSSAITVMVLATSIGQVLALKTLFSEKKPLRLLNGIK